MTGTEAKVVYQLKTTDSNDFQLSFTWNNPYWGFSPFQTQFNKKRRKNDSLRIFEK